MTHVSVRAPCGARVAGLMFLSDCPAAAGVDGIRAEPYNEGVLTSLGFRPGLWTAAPSPSPEEGARGFGDTSFRYVVIDSRQGG